MRWPSASIPAALFLLHQYLIHIGRSTAFLQSYLDDFLVLPLALSAINDLSKWLSRPLHLKQLIVFAIIGVIWFGLLFELILPQSLRHGTADPFDLLAYALGAASYLLLSARLSKPMPNKA